MENVEKKKRGKKKRKMCKDGNRLQDSLDDEGK